MKPIIYMAIGAMIPFACIEIKKTNGFKSMINALEKKVQEMSSAIEKFSQDLKNNSSEN